MCVGSVSESTVKAPCVTSVTFTLQCMALSLNLAILLLLILDFNLCLGAFRRKSLCSSLMGTVWIRLLMDSKWLHSPGTL